MHELKILKLYPLQAMCLAYGYNDKFYLSRGTSYRGDILIDTYYSNAHPGTIAGKAYVVVRLENCEKIHKGLYRWSFTDIRVIEPVKINNSNNRKFLFKSPVEYEDLNICPEEPVKAVKAWQREYFYPQVIGVTKSSRGEFKVHDIRDYLEL